MTITVELFRTRFPEYADPTEYPDPRIQLFIDDTADYIGVDEARWNGRYDRAQSYLAAHLLSIASKSEYGDSNANVGAVTSKSAGGVSVGRSVVAKDRSDGDDFYVSTSYGQQFLVIRNITFIGVLSVN